jgi:hypothetical protein
MVDHAKAPGQDRMQQSMFGSGYATKARAFDLALEVLNA